MHEITSDAGQFHTAGGPTHACRLDPLEHLVEGQLNLDELARAIGCDLRSLAHWAMQPENALTLAGLLRLADARTQLALGRYRMHAAMQLVRIMGGEQSDTKIGDLMRKACVDLLTIESSLAPPGASSRSSAAGGGENPDAEPPAPLPQAIILALEALGRGEELD